MSAVSPDEARAAGGSFRPELERLLLTARFATALAGRLLAALPPLPGTRGG